MTLVQKSPRWSGWMKRKRVKVQLSCMHSMARFSYIFTCKWSVNCDSGGVITLLCILDRIVSLASLEFSSDPDNNPALSLPNHHRITTMSASEIQPGRYGLPLPWVIVTVPPFLARTWPCSPIQLSRLAGNANSDETRKLNQKWDIIPWDAEVPTKYLIESVADGKYIINPGSSKSLGTVNWCLLAGSQPNRDGRREAWDFGKPAEQDTAVYGWFPEPPNPCRTRSWSLTLKVYLEQHSKPSSSRYWRVAWAGWWP